MNSKSQDIMAYWPFKYSPRKSQVHALQWIANQDAKYIILEAPVGSGKSNIGITYSAYLNQQSFILTPQRILQEQYDISFRDISNINLSVLYGKSNYKCANKKTTCDIGSIVKPKCDRCPHNIAKKEARLAKNTVLNYKLALTSFAFTTTFSQRKLMILDECHTLEEHLVDFDALQILHWRCKKYDLPFIIPKDLTSAINWLKDSYLPKLTDKLDDLQAECDILFEKPGNALTRADIKVLRELDSFADHVDAVQEMVLRTDEYIDNNFVFVHDPVHFELKRLTGEHSFNHIVNPMADKFLFMSSTILDKDGFCRDLGIDPNNTAFLSLDSDFPVDNRPVIYMPRMKMNYKWNYDENKSNRKELIQTIRQLLDIHKDDSGIIHTGNFAIAEWLVSELKDDNHVIFHHNPDSDNDRNSVINSFINCPSPSILISPSSTEGLDLKEELGRFAIFAKVPFGHLGNQWIKRRMELSNEWYSRRALIDMIQGGGRVVRSETDKGTVYILDGSFGMLYQRSNNMIPDWWKEAYIVI